MEKKEHVYEGQQQSSTLQLKGRLKGGIKGENCNLAIILVVVSARLGLILCK